MNAHHEHPDSQNFIRKILTLLAQKKKFYKKSLNDTNDEYYSQNMNVILVKYDQNYFLYPIIRKFHSL